MVLGAVFPLGCVGNWKKKNTLFHPIVFLYLMSQKAENMNLAKKLKNILHFNLYQLYYLLIPHNYSIIICYFTLR